MTTTTLPPVAEGSTGPTATAYVPGPDVTDRADTPPPRRGRMATLVRGRPDDPAWSRPALLVLLLATGLLYTWNLSASGTANSFYAAAVKSGSESWKAWFFGSLDSASSITVDKPPASLWVMGLSARLFGFSSWSLLVPQALEGVATVGLLYATVKRWSGPTAGLIAGAVMALTPAAVLMFRFDNPDALLVLLMVGAAYAVTRALEKAGTRWLLLAGALVGFAFLTKMMQGFLVLPAFALVYLVAAPTTLGRRIGQVLGAGLAVVVAAGWWLLAVGLWPASSRPYIGGSTNNSVLNLVFGYNGLGRLFGSEGNGGGGGGGGTAGSSFGGATGLKRLFSSEMGNEISWLLPAALVALVAGLWVTRGAPRTDRTRAALILWGGWLLVTGLVFSYMEGTIHPYYTVALAPAIGALVATGGTALWHRRDLLTSRIGLAAIVVAAGGWSYVVLARTASWHPELRYLVAVLTVLAAVGLLIPPARMGRTAAGRAAKGLLVTGVLAGIIGTGSFGLATAATAHTGSIPSVGPAAASASTGGGFGGGARTGGFGGGSAPTGTRPTGTRPTGTRPTGSAPTGSAPTGTGGGTGGTTSTSTALVTALKATTTRWAAAVVGDQSAADLILNSDRAVMAIGGWSGSDNSPTLAQFEQYVATGKIHYFIASGTGGGGAGANSGVGAQITTWVKAHYTATTIGGSTVYDLTKAAS
jgi:4-amino-4-deoxy-L-arabinose transferase-like glycosyltransferase